MSLCSFFCMLISSCWLEDLPNKSIYLLQKHYDKRYPQLGSSNLYGPIGPFWVVNSLNLYQNEIHRDFLKLRFVIRSFQRLCAHKTPAWELVHHGICSKCVWWRWQCGFGRCLSLGKWVSAWSLWILKWRAIEEHIRVLLWPHTHTRGGGEESILFVKCMQ